MAKKVEYSVEERLRALYDLQLIDSRVDKIRSVRGELPLEVEDLEAVVGKLLDDDERDEVDTVGGLVFALAGRVPSRGEVVRHRIGIQFEILDGDPRRITLLKIRGLPRAVAKQDQD